MNISNIQAVYQIIKEDGFDSSFCSLVDHCDNCAMSRLAFNDILTLKDVYCGNMHKNEEAVLNKLLGIIRKKKLEKLLK